VKAPNRKLVAAGVFVEMGDSRLVLIHRSRSYVKLEAEIVGFEMAMGVWMCKMTAYVDLQMISIADLKLAVIISYCSDLKATLTRWAV